MARILGRTMRQPSIGKIVAVVCYFVSTSESNALDCPGRWVSGGGGMQCLCADGSLADYVGGQVVCRGAGTQHSGQSRSELIHMETLLFGRPQTCGPQWSTNECWTIRETRAKLVAKLVVRCDDGNINSCNEVISIPDVSNQAKTEARRKRDMLIGRNQTGETYLDRMQRESDQPPTGGIPAEQMPSCEWVLGQARGNHIPNWMLQNCRQ